MYLKGERINQNYFYDHSLLLNSNIWVIVLKYLYVESHRTSNPKGSAIIVYPLFDKSLVFSPSQNNEVGKEQEMSRLIA